MGLLVTPGRGRRGGAAQRRGSWPRAARLGVGLGHLRHAGEALGHDRRVRIARAEKHRDRCGPAGSRPRDRPAARARSRPAGRRRDVPHERPARLRQYGRRDPRPRSRTTPSISSRLRAMMSSSSTTRMRRSWSGAMQTRQRIIPGKFPGLDARSASGAPWSTISELECSRMADDPVLARAVALLERVPLVDGHNDLPYVIRAGQDGEGRRRGLGSLASAPGARHGHSAPARGPRRRAVLGRLPCPTNTPHPARTTLELIDIILQLTSASPGRPSSPPAAPRTWRAPARRGKIALLHRRRGRRRAGEQPGPLRVWRAAGARLMTLCHNETLDWVDSATDAPRHGGLTPFGRAWCWS